MGLYLSKDGVSKIWTKAKSTFQTKGNYVTTDTVQTISGVKTYNAPTNVNGSEQTTTKFKTSNGGAIILGKEGPNSGTMIRLDQKDGTCRLRFRSSATAGAMVWEQPEQGAKLYIDLGKDGADKHRISFPSSAGTLALKSQIPTVNNGTLTIQKNGTNVQTFTANQSGNVTANITVPTKVSELTNDSGYINDVEITSSSSGSTLVKGTTGSNADDPGSGPRYPATGTINIGLGATDITITPLAAIDANGSYNPSTGDYSWTLYAATEKAKVTGTIKWSGGDDQLKITKNGTENIVGYFNKINGQSIVALDSPKDFSFYNKTEVDNKLSGKSDTNHTHESILDYGNTNKTIKIGYSGNGLTASQILYIAGYTAGDNDNEHKIKDISKDVLKSWLGYAGAGAEITTGILGPNSNLPDITNPSYFWIVYPDSPSSSSFAFDGNTAYHFAVIQGGTPGSIRYFKSTTTLAYVQTTSIRFTNAMKYVRFKIE